MTVWLGFFFFIVLWHINNLFSAKSFLYIYKVRTISFQTFFRVGTFIDSTHMKL